MANPYYARGAPLRAKNELAARAGFDVAAWVLDRAPLHGRLAVLDVGCGWGRFAVPLSARLEPGSRPTCCDVWPGMVADCRDAVGREAGLVAADARTLPFGDERFDVATAMHMLYELADPTVAASELRRVVRPGGSLRASTYSESRPVPLIELHTAALASFGVEHVERTSSFSLENGADVLGAAFEHVTVTTFDEHVPFDADAITDVYRHTGRHHAARFPDDDRLAERFHELALAWPDDRSVTTWALFSAR